MKNVQKKKKKKKKKKPQEEDELQLEDMLAKNLLLKHVLRDQNHQVKF